MSKTVVIVPNWNGVDTLMSCLASLDEQTLKPYIIVVDNGSIDESVKMTEENYPGIEIIRHSSNMGYAGGVNPGFRRAIELGADYAAAFNNDAVANKDWLEFLVRHMDAHGKVGIATCKLLDASGKHIDSTGDYYTAWGLPYPRGRGETDLTKYDTQTDIFAASGGASLYRVSMLEQIGFFDEDFFAYYEDVDLSFRAQLAGWKVHYVPSSIAYHQISATSNRIKGFATYQTMKNQPVLLLKNVPRKYMFRIGWRFTLAHALFFIRAISRDQGWSALKGDWKGTVLLFTGFKKRRYIQRQKKVSDEYIWSMIIHDLPPNAFALKKMRSTYWKLIGKHS
jgi:GT2 family glycosyltransferase